ncbi:hypothetical protein Ahy_A09g045238 isoform A [Arachis hypogaea]|uniref:Uncharacterized protein n=1 Tax=Arachis hypogaea TaxID=3818 RepID=A0A445BLX0_ARAHY|nr:hypothetical protein Ahy_A09g045238 isoform A [Arachis hypogaea]
MVFTESNGTIKQAHLSIVLKFNEKFQTIGDEAGILSGIFELLSADYNKFLICEKDWRKISSKDKIYNECIKDSRGIIKRTIIKSIGRSWEKMRSRLWFLDYCNSEDTKQLYTHTGGSKSLARHREEKSELQERKVSRGELWTLVHK